MQHHEVVKVGCIVSMMDKMCAHEWLDRLQKILTKILKHMPKMSLQSCKINDGSCNRAENDLKFKTLSRNIPKNMEIHVEKSVFNKIQSAELSSSCFLS